MLCIVANICLGALMKLVANIFSCVGAMSDAHRESGD